MLSAAFTHFVPTLKRILPHPYRPHTGHIFHLINLDTFDSGCVSPRARGKLMLSPRTFNPQSIKVVVRHL